jgi:hypothetical protein
MIYRSYIPPKVAKRMVEEAERKQLERELRRGLEKPFRDDRPFWRYPSGIVAYAISIALMGAVALVVWLFA